MNHLHTIIANLPAVEVAPQDLLAIYTAFTEIEQHLDQLETHLENPPNQNPTELLTHMVDIIRQFVPTVKEHMGSEMQQDWAADFNAPECQ